MAIAFNSLWLLMTLVPFALVIRYGVITREEVYLERSSATSIAATTRGYGAGCRACRPRYGVGDALEMPTVKRALTGVDFVIQSLGVSAGPEMILKPTRLFSKATRVLVTAMEQAHVKRLISVTGFGAGDSRGHGGASMTCASSAGASSILRRLDYQKMETMAESARRVGSLSPSLT